MSNYDYVKKMFGEDTSEVTRRRITTWLDKNDRKIDRVMQSHQEVKHALLKRIDDLEYRLVSTGSNLSEVACIGKKLLEAHRINEVDWVAIAELSVWLYKHGKTVSTAVESAEESNSEDEDSNMKNLKALKKEAKRLKKLAAEVYRDTLDLIDDSLRDAVKKLPNKHKEYTYEINYGADKTITFAHLCDAWSHRLGLNAGCMFAVKDGVKRKIGVYDTRDPKTGCALKGYSWFFIDDKTKLEFEHLTLLA